jgi:hypothetical protein
LNNNITNSKRNLEFNEYLFYMSVQFIHFIPRLIHLIHLALVILSLKYQSPALIIRPTAMAIIVIIIIIAIMDSS